MHFGDDDTVCMISSNIADSTDDSWYNKLFCIIEQDARVYLRKYHFTPENEDDIVQDIQIKVVTKLIQYLENAEHYSESERNGWLARVSQNAAMDFLRRSANKYWDSIDELSEKHLMDHTNVENQTVIKMQLFEAFQKLSEIRTTPDRILAYLLNKIEGIGSHSGSHVKWIAGTMRNKTLGEVYLFVVAELETILNETIPEHIMKPLKDVIEPGWNEVFEMDVRTITDSSSWIAKKMRI